MILSAFTVRSCTRNTSTHVPLRVILSVTFLLVALCFGNARILAQIPPDRFATLALQVFPQKTSELEYDSVSRIRAADHSANIQEKYIDGRLLALEKHLREHNILAADVEELMIGSSQSKGGRRDYGLILPSPSARVLRSESQHRQGRPDGIDCSSSESFCTADTGSMIAFGAFEDVSEMRLRILGTTKRNVIDPILRNAFLHLDSTAPVRGVGLGDLFADWAQNSLGTSFPATFRLISDHIKYFGYTVQLSRPLRIQAQVGWTSNIYRIAAKELLYAVSGAKQVLPAGMNIQSVTSADDNSVVIQLGLPL
jgi:hypothetical protein